jgi:hypothetical protein
LTKEQQRLRIRDAWLRLLLVQENLGMSSEESLNLLMTRCVENARWWERP